jgi:hypothetical protein
VSVLVIIFFYPPYSDCGYGRGDYSQLQPPAFFRRVTLLSYHLNIMKIDLESVVASNPQPKGGFELLKKLGSLRDNLDPSDEVDFSQTNLDKTEKQAVLFIYETSGEVPKKLNCSTKLSVVVRKALKSATREQVISGLLDLEIVLKKNGLRVLCPKGNPHARISVAELLKAPKVQYEELQAWG